MNAPLEALDIYGTIKWGEVGAQQTLPFDRGSNGQFLQTDGGGVLTFATIDTVTITDSNTNTSFPIVFNNESGGLLDDTGSFTYNPFTGKMTVDGTANVYGESGSVTSAVFGHSSFTSRQNSGFYQQSTGDTFVNAKPGQVINFNSGYNTKMTMNDLGLFGIGTTTPDASLSVVGNIKASGTLTAGEGTDISCILGYTNIGYTGSNGYVGFSHTANSNFTDFALLQALEGFTVLNAKSGLDIHFTIGLDMKMNLSPAGKLGIGHTFQAYHLDVSGDTMLRVMNNTGAAGKLLFGRTGGNGTTTDNRSHAIEAYSAVGPSNNYLKFLVHDGATSLSDGRTEVMAMTGDGYVGINTDKPTTHLNVLGTISTGRNLAREVGTVTDYSSQFSAARGAANVIDGFKNYENGNHDWLTAAGAKNNAYVTIDLGAAYFVDRIVVYNQNEYAASNREVKHFTLQGSSDGTTFTSILTNELGRSNAHEPNPGWSFKIPQNWDDDNEGIQYRYFKFIMTSFISDVPDKAGIMEIELYEAANTVDDIVSTSAIVAQDVYSQVGNFSRGLTVGPGFGGVATGQSNLFVQGNVGIGLADPTKKLEVIGDISCSGAVESLYCKLGGSTNTGSEFATFSHYNMSNDSDYAFGQIDGFATRINCKSGQTIQFRNNGSTEWARFDSNGNFDCVNNIEAGVSKMGSGTSEGGIAIGLFAHKAMLDDNNYALAQKNGQDTRINAKTGQIIQFNNNGITELARFQPSGNFGIGITNPTKKLEVIGDISSSGGGSFGNAALGNHSGIYAKFHHKDVTGANDYAVIQTDTGRTYLNSKSGQSLFLAINNQVRMTVKAGHQGNIGIGTENPTEKLEVVGNIKATGDIQMETLSTPVIGKMTPIYARGYGQHNASTKIVRIGDVQVVNTTTRGLTLTIINAGTHAHVSSTNYDTLMGSTNGDLLATAIEGLNDDEIGILTSADAFESVGFGGLGANLKAAALKVGLPVLAAFCDWTTNKRHPYAAIFYGPGASSLPSGQAVEITKSRDSSAAYATLSTWLIDDTFIGQVLTTALYNPIGDSTEPVVFVGATGNVGIGSIAPTAKLEVYPDTNINATIGKANIGYNGFGNWAAFSHMDCANTTDYAMMQLNTGITLINSASGQSIQFKNNDSLKMSLSADGQLGIGTTPGYMLQVNGWASNTTVSWINLASGSTTTGQNPTINTIPSGVSIYASHGVMSGTGYFQGSDDRIKSFEVPLALGLDEIIQLEPKSYLKHPEFLVPEDDETGSTLPIDASGNLYQLATDSSGNVIIDSSGNSVKEPMYAEMEYGLISQEMLLIPGMELLVTEDKSVDKIKNVNYTGLIPVLINGIKELKTINDTQAATITAQAAMIAALDARLTALEN
ncbi:hypothetical protein PGBG_00001 [Phaeocystis globosa virus 14T]|nr:hypothetical protein PGBG_00001 [Phaeocystis globosa virus 14T]